MFHSLSHWWCVYLWKARRVKQSVSHANDFYLRVSLRLGYWLSLSLWNSKRTFVFHVVSYQVIWEWFGLNSFCNVRYWSLLLDAGRLWEFLSLQLRQFLSYYSRAVKILHQCKQPNHGTITARRALSQSERIVGASSFGVPWCCAFPNIRFPLCFLYFTLSMLSAPSDSYKSLLYGASS